MLIRTKLIVLMVLLFINIIVIMGYALFTLVTSKDRVHDMLTVDYHKIDVAHDFRTVMHVANKTVYEAIFVDEPSPKATNRAIIRLNSLKEAFPVMLDDLTSGQSVDETELLEMLDILRSNSEPYLNILSKIIVLMQDQSFEEAKAIYSSTGFSRSREILFRNIDDLILLLKVDLVHDAEAFDQAVEESYVLYSVIAMASVLLFMIVIWRAEVTIIRPIKRISHLMNQLLLRGEFDADLASQERDEIGYMSSAMSDLLTYIDQAISDANRVVDAIARADFSQRMTMDYVGALGALKQGINASANSVSYMMDELAKVMYALHEGKLDVQMDDKVPAGFRNLVESALSETRQLTLDINFVMSSLNSGDMRYRVQVPANGAFLVMKNNINLAIDELEVTMKALENAKDAAEQASRAKSQFVHNMTHELRTPLNAILGFTQLLSMDDQLKQHNRDSLMQIEVAANHLLGIVNQVLDMSQIETGKFAISHHAFDLREVISSSLEMVNDFAQQRGLSLTSEIAESVPTEWMMGDAMRLREVIINLLTNAIKFTDVGRVCLRIWREADRLYIEVQDTGIGIADDHIHKLFKAFSQADEGVSRQFGGTGLGLVLSKELVEQMGGEIQLTSALGMGTRVMFYIHLELASSQHLSTPNACMLNDAPQPTLAVAAQVSVSQTESQQPTPARSENTSASELPHPLLAAKRVLLVEDNKINQIVAVKLLEKLGIKPDVANHGQEAMDMRQHCCYDLILLDIQMPIKDGYTTITEIREEELQTGKHQLVVGLSANGLQQDVDKAMSLGMDDYLTKPIDFPLFQARVCYWLLGEGAAQSVK